MIYRHFSRKRLLWALIAAALVLSMILPQLGAVPVHADSPPPVDCNGDLLCELGQVIQSEATKIITPLQEWARFTANAGLYGLLYSITMTVAQVMWSIAKALITVSVQVGVLIDWIASHFFQPMITMTGQTFKPIVGMFFFIAMVLLGVSYILAAVIRINIVNPRNMVLWWVAGALFFSTGTSIYASMRNLSQSLNGLFYASALNTINGDGSDGSTNPFGQMAADDTSSDIQMPAPCINFSAYIPSAKLSGGDIALAYLSADGFDVLKNGTKCMGGGKQAPLPRAWYADGGYFDPVDAPDLWRIGDTECGLCSSLSEQVDKQITIMVRATNNGFSALARLLQSIPLVWFSIVEQFVSLCLIIAQGLTFVSFACAILFALFKRTEPIAWTIIDNWLSLIIQTIVVAMIQALVLALYIAAANTGSPLITLAVSVVGLVLMSILLVSGLKAVWNSFNRLFEAFSNATGNVMVTPGAMAGATASMALAAGGVIVGGAAALGVGVIEGAGAMSGGYNALANGGTWAQAAGITLGGSRALDGAAYVLTRLPGLRETSLGEAANQYIEGSTVKAVGESLTGSVPLAGSIVKRLAGPSVGATLLTDRNPENEEAYLDEQGNQYWRRPMLRPDTGKAMESALTGPTWEPGAMAQIGQGGSPLRGDNGEAFRRSDIPAEMEHAVNGWGSGEKFTVAQSTNPLAQEDVDQIDADIDRNAAVASNDSRSRSNVMTVNNDGNLDETIQQEMQRTLAANRQDADGGNRSGKSDTGDSSAKALENAANRLDTTAARAGDALTRAGETLGRSVQVTDAHNRIEPVEGRLTQNGSNNIALIMGQAIDTLRQENAATGRVGADNAGVSAAMAGALEITPVVRNGKAIDPIERDVPRFQMFADQALMMGLGGRAAEYLVREIKSNPDGKLSPESRDSLIHFEHDERGQSWQDSTTSVARLEHTVRMLPGDISAYGIKEVPAGSSSAAPIIFTTAPGTDAQPIVFTPTKPASPANNPSGNHGTDTPATSKEESRS